MDLIKGDHHGRLFSFFIKGEFNLNHLYLNNLKFYICTPFLKGLFY